jgi:hypothetical protein
LKVDSASEDFDGSEETLAQNGDWRAAKRKISSWQTLH